ncbi:MAG: M20/M25/M40 family metallo-hydrolase [Opitutales bacterium]
MVLFNRGAFRVLLLLLVVLVAVLVYGWAMMIWMPGKSFQGKLPPWTEEEMRLSATLAELVEEIAGEIGERNIQTPDRYHEAADFIEERFHASGYAVKRQTFDVSGVACSNLEAAIRGASRPDEIIVIGAHYDTVPGSPGANDNTSGVAGTLALASLMADSRPGRTVRFVAFANEETPYFYTENMGSLRYARQARENGEKIVGMISLETIGYFSDEQGSQKYPFPLNRFYPSRGNFVGFVTHTRADSRVLLREAIAVFRERTSFPSEGAILPERIPGVGWSDHWAFWQAGYPAFMITDTAPYRYPHYHTEQDTPEKLDYPRMARIVKGIESVVAALAATEEKAAQ